MRLGAQGLLHVVCRDSSKRALQLLVVVGAVTVVTLFLGIANAQGSDLSMLRLRGGLSSGMLPGSGGGNRIATLHLPTGADELDLNCSAQDCLAGRLEAIGQFAQVHDLELHHKVAPEGIVICMGGYSYTTNGLVLVHLLLDSGVDQIEVAYADATELPHPVRSYLLSLKVSLLDVSMCMGGADAKGYQIKIWAMWCSKYVNVLLLDADNVPTGNPQFLFTTGTFLRTGNLFWPDVPTVGLNLIPRRALGPVFAAAHNVSVESGQIVLNCSANKHALLAALLFQASMSFREFLFASLHGDKNLWALAFQAVGSTLSIVRTSLQPVLSKVIERHVPGGTLKLFASCGAKKYTSAIAQHSPETLDGQDSDRPLFVHRVRDEWNEFDLLPRWWGYDPNATWDPRTSTYRSQLDWLTVPPYVMDVERRGINHLRALRPVLASFQPWAWTLKRVQYLIAHLFALLWTRYSCPSTPHHKLIEGVIASTLPLGDLAFVFAVILALLVLLIIACRWWCCCKGRHGHVHATYDVF
eukprot:TRINITY_DN27266_c0_g1_i2.p1 TRINITY_DN27266_c0_g1~~TRINITY_DN27266_c0_g1_i2.p1  ORF type:complete len:526 (-),score=46.85 TRINITY_DN27266_c0_g1_i2:41-1618(-)